MMVRRIFPILLTLVVAAGCSSTSRNKEPKDHGNVSPPYAGATDEIKTWGDLDQYDGKRISIEGRFDHLKGIHGVIIKDNGLRVYIPHFDLHARGSKWFDYVDRRVRATGILHSYDKPIPGYHGPTLELTNGLGSFSVVR